MLVQFDEEAARELYSEGGRAAVIVNRFERDSHAREKCISHHGLRYSVCDMSFRERYGETMKHFIQVHHLVPLSEIGTKYQVDPITDLRPVCPNCHAVIHRDDPPLSIEQARALLSH
jgi:5-methylcytosine-specific restriction protein A